MIIYKLTSPSGKSYIGQTIRSLEHRISEHRISNYTIGHALRKYPNLDEWDISIIEQIDTLEALDEAEIKWIAHFDSYNNGYNMTEGGFGFKGLERTEEHNQKISKARKEFFLTKEGQEWSKVLSKRFSENNPCKSGNKPWNYQIKDCFTEESLDKMSKSQLKRYEDPEQRQKASDNISNLWARGVYDNRPQQTPEQIRKRADAARGFKQSDYQKQRAREANTGKIVSDETRAKLSDINTGRILKDKICPHCGTNAPGGNYNRWHGENCRNKKSED